MQRRPTDPKEIGPDGIQRSEDVERQINSLFASTFAGPDGQRVLDYLRAITVNRVNGPEVSEAALRHQEGMRFLFHVIHQRVERGKRQ